MNQQAAQSLNGRSEKKKKPAPKFTRGWIVLDKPQNMTSAQAGNIIKRVLGGAKLGHAGTLDPLATGILPFAVGETTKLIPYLVDGRKSYRFTVEFGQARDTDDAEGKIIGQSDKIPSVAEIKAILPKFTGVISQVPPQFSAMKIQGERAYDLARAGEVVELAARPVLVTRFELMQITDKQAEFEVDCGKGTYVRSLARDIAKALGTLGYVTALCRTRVGPFDLSRAISLEKLKEVGYEAGPWLLPATSALDDILALDVDPVAAARLRAGHPISAAHAQTLNLTEGAMLRVRLAGHVFALAKLEEDWIRPMKFLK